MARTVAQIQAEMAGLPTSFATSSRGGGAQVGGAEWQKRQALQQELAALQRTERYPTQTIEGAAQTAMEETQRRAAEDRAAALAGVTGRETQALEAITGREPQALEAITAGRERGLGMFAGTEELLAQARGEVTPEREAMMFEQGRIPIEAQTQARQRQIQEAYARGGAPGGAAMREVGVAGEAGLGQISELQRQIQLDRYQKLMGLTGQAGQIAGAQAGIVGQAGRSLADIYQQTGRGVADIRGGAGRTLADIYANTITAVPDYSQVAGLGATGGTTVTSGGMRRAPAKPKATWPTGGGVWGSQWNLRR